MSLRPEDLKLEVPEVNYPLEKPIERAIGKKRAQLERECAEILAKTSLTGDEFNNFVSKMIELLGGYEETTELGTNRHSAVISGGMGHDFTLVRAKEYPWDFSGMNIRPATNVGENPFYMEMITYGSKMDLYDSRTRLPQPHLIMETLPIGRQHSVFFGPKYQIEDVSSSFSHTSSVFPISKEQVLNASRAVFNLYRLGNDSGIQRIPLNQ